MKKLKPIFMISLLLLIYVYVCSIASIPSNYVLFQEEKLNVKTLFGVSLQKKENNKPEIMQASANFSGQIETLEKEEYQVSLFDKIPVKNVSVNVIPKTKVVPVGASVGLKLYTNGVLVVGMSEIENIQKEKDKPYENTGIKEGDMIVALNKKEITCTADLVQTVNSSQGEEISVEYVREGNKYETNIKPSKTVNNEYKLGLWVRDAAAGVGTISFYEPNTGMYGALGHGIIDVDTEELITIAKGELVTTNIIDVVKGEKGKAGEIRGSIHNQKKVGQVYKNTAFGIYGKMENLTSLNINSANAIEVATRDEIKEGPAKIICTLENNKTEEYEIEIQKIMKNNNTNNKSMILKVTDSRLLEKTGGIVQGMSGSPIIQNGKFCGAVTHVLVNDPTSGYGVFADLMLKQIREAN